MKRRFGRVAKPDKRDERFLLSPPKRPKYRRRHWSLGSNLDQGETTACVGYAWAGFLAASPINQSPIAPSGIYAIAKRYDEWDGEDYDGTSVRGGADVLRLTGHVSEYRWCWDVDTAAKWVLSRGPLVIGVDWYEGMDETDSQGFIHVDGESEGGHAALLYGVNLDHGHASIRNSWGRQWGDRGNCRISLDDLSILLDDGGECCAATEVML